MITPLRARIIARPHLPKRKRTVTCASRPRQEITPAKVIEAVSGKAAVYGVILGTANWVAGDINPLEQMHYAEFIGCLLYTSPSPRDVEESRMPSSA